MPVKKKLPFARPMNIKHRLPIKHKEKKTWTQRLKEQVMRALPT